MSDFVKELNFDGDTFNDMKRDMNFVLQRLLGNMQEKECQEGTLTLKLDVSLVREYVPNYNPNIPGESREIAKPKFSHKVTSQMKVEDMKKGNLDTEMELFLNEETGEYEMRPVADTTQRSIFDADYRDVTEPGPALCLPVRPQPAGPTCWLPSSGAGCRTIRLPRSCRCWTRPSF